MIRDLVSNLVGNQVVNQVRFVDGIQTLSLTSTANLEAWNLDHSGTYTRASTINDWDTDAVLNVGIPNDVASFYGARWTDPAFFNTDLSGDALTNTIGLSNSPSVTNQFAADEYRDFDNWDSYSAIVTKNQVGVDGTPNSASVLEDDNASGFEQISETFVVADDTNWHCFALAILKDSETTRYPALKLDLTGGAGIQEYGVLNTQAGTANEVPTFNEGELFVFDAGVFWVFFVAIQNNGTGNTSMGVTIAPAYSTNGTNYDVAATGSIIADWAQFCNARRCPLPLVVGAETLALGDLHCSSAGLIKETLGDDVVVNGDFTTDYTPWHITNGANPNGWNWVNGHMVCDSNGVGRNLGQNNIFEVGKTYEVTLDVINVSSKLSLYGLIGTPEITSTGTQTIIGVANSATPIIYCSSSATAEINSVIIKEVLHPKGSIYLEYQALPDYAAVDNTVLLASGNTEIRAESLTSGISFNDGTNDTVGSVGTPSGVIKAVVRWEGTSVYITTVNGTTTGTYAGNFGDGTIYFGRNSTGNAFPGILIDYKFWYNEVITEAKADTWVA